MEYMYITNDIEMARICDKTGIDRVWIDLEWKGKEERQKNMNSVKSKHSISDISKIKNVLKHSKLMVRINPMDSDSQEEIKRVLDAGAEIVMVPMLKKPEEAEKFCQLVGTRAKKVLLLETKEAQEGIDKILRVGNFDEVHIGLNDLSLSHGFTFMFELLANGMVEELCKILEKYGIPYGFGGIAKIGYGMLPAEKILAEHYRLGSTRAILSRSFFVKPEEMNYGEAERIVLEEFHKIKRVEEELMQWHEEQFWNNHRDVIAVTKQILHGDEKK